ncbi:unnamed protein product [Acanthoscelides obtectus]|uniref:Uncharacterized protein n=1 Tax=Acanthoscelides obtectus TaxID=200917 RepID=A0A9P0K1Y4_ACAOB|nr:unnamed protein product [Acanthoscelides obtectus]CAK1665905.1 hypothetical protein AOBTE_LOCUS25038 [Acanthoscelides obtectus]
MLFLTDYICRIIDRLPYRQYLHNPRHYHSICSSYDICINRHR